MPDLTGSLIPVSVFGARMTSEGETSSWRWDLLLKDFCIFSLFFFYHHILMSQPSKPETEWGKGCASVRDNEAILSCPRFYHLALTTTFWTKMLPFRCFAAHVIQSGSECVTVKTPPPPPHPTPILSGSYASCYDSRLFLSFFSIIGWWKSEQSWPRQGRKALGV